MWESLTAARDLGRVQEIASVLVRYGFGDLIRRMGLEGVLARAGQVLPTAAEQLARGGKDGDARRASRGAGGSQRSFGSRSLSHSQLASAGVQ